MRRKPGTIAVLLISAFGLSLTALPMPSAAQETDSKSPVMARTIAGLGVSLPMIASRFTEGNAAVVLYSSGLVLGPIAGYVYAGHPKLGLRPATYRALAVGATYGGVLRICSRRDCSLMGLWFGEGRHGLLPAIAVWLTGLSVTAVLIVRDIERIADLVERGSSSSVTWTPTFAPESGGFGFEVTVRH